MAFVYPGQVDVRAELIDSTLKGFALRMYKMKQVVTIASTGAWKNYFFRESPDTLTAGRNRSAKGIARGASFPQASESWEKVASLIDQYGLEDTIPYQDIIAGEVNVRDRTLMRIAEGVTYAVDRQIYSGLKTGAYNSFTLASGYQWTYSSSAIMDDLEQAEQLIGTYQYDTSNLMVLVSLRDKRSVMAYLLAKGAQIPQITQDKVNNGVIGTLGNKTFIVSDVVGTSEALVCAAKVCATWKELEPLKTYTHDEPGKDVLIRAWEHGVLQVTDPKAICLIKNTQL